MIVKILNSSSKFNGVSYNTKKTDKDLGELMKVKNFGYLQAVTNVLPEEYKNYLIFHSSTNSKVKDQQFHAVITCKGREYDKHQLTGFADAFLKEMGYGDNPYLIVFHKDTNNNHVHLVSSRIDSEGKKISDAFEYKRAYAAVQKILQNDIKLSTDKLINRAFDYSISTVAQFKLLFEQQGYIVTHDDKEIALRKFDDIQQRISIDKINERITLSVKDESRIRQLKAIFEKYSSLADPSLKVIYEPTKYKDDKKPIGYTSDLVQGLKQKFGIDIVFHGKKGLPPYGYSIIDHNSKAVFKGSDIMPLKLFLDHSRYRKQPQSSIGNLEIKVDGFKEKEASQKIFRQGMANISFNTISQERLALISILLKSALHEFNSVGEGLSRHHIEAHVSDKSLFILDKKTGFMIDAERVLNQTDLNLLAKHSGLELPQKEKVIPFSEQTEIDVQQSKNEPNERSAAVAELNYEESAILGAMQNFDLSIADDVDDEQINGRNRRRVRKARINTR
ncbi:relaxase/mobilization nuclease domain-containing protein (plasmid) [Mucilaginibacter robiniae]|uniref:Relaxase/mobilization nuclease domain-containing protein n=1 Tax=Mucilaginibacter robiniae TaxID=2728022 RepID=A0A7L5E9R3_9SPHI|nr:relaxase/mobilization nuclease domain-containing protein [Mucilaginibacter robiniae]QJD98564.1 relaxase/mobilization nuclease domain-containing protein [Mucilaginibacter robiniae]